MDATLTSRSHTDMPYRDSTESQAPGSVRRAAAFALVAMVASATHSGARADSPPEPQTGVVEINPLVDAGLLVSGLSLGLSLELIISTGELTPQQPGDPNKLSAIDRPFAKRHGTNKFEVSTVGLGAIGAFMITDVVLAGVYDRGDPWYDYTVMYLESLAMTLVLTDLIKIAVRRPRPEAYAAVRDTGEDNEGTNSALSFISGHASIAAAVSSTATYMAFARDSTPIERWSVLAGGAALTGVVGMFRVVEGKHFPTDVIAGMSVGATIGLLVPYLHRPEAGSLALLPTGSGLALTSQF